MNFNIYLEDELEKELQNIVQLTGKSRNPLIKEAIKRLIYEHHKSQWSQKILDFQGLEDGIDFESYRQELLAQEEVEVI